MDKARVHTAVEQLYKRKLGNDRAVISIKTVPILTTLGDVAGYTTSIKLGVGIFGANVVVHTFEETSITVMLHNEPHNYPVERVLADLKVFNSALERVTTVIRRIV